MKGKIQIVTECWVQCVGEGCLQSNIYHGWRLKDAERDFRNDGWSKKKDGWTCPKCRRTG